MRGDPSSLVGGSPACAEGAEVSIPLLIRVACDATYCRSYGISRRVLLRRVALGVVEVPTLLCQSCGCHVKQLPEDEDMPKITRHGGPSNAAAETVPTTTEEEGERSSPGKSSTPSPVKPETSVNETSDPSPAPTTESPSVKARTGSSSARGTAGGRTPKRGHK